jgi:hypothetical protein
VQYRPLNILRKYTSPPCDPLVMTGGALSAAPTPAPTLSFQVEAFSGAFRDAEKLMRRHWEEIAQNKQLLNLNPDVEKYELLDAAGKLLLVTARCQGVLVGYFLWVLVDHPHYRDVRVADDDLHYLAPEFRVGLSGYNFVKRACEFAIERGARLLVMREKIGHEHPALMKRLKFKPTDVVYTRAV